jgi:small multidrug resistance pump
MQYLYLIIAIVAEVIATTSLKSTNGFTRLWPVLVMAAGYGVAFYMLSIIVQTMPLGVVYAMWSGAGIVLVAIAGAIWFNQIPDWPAILGIALIVAGVVIVNLFSKTVVH